MTSSELIYLCYETFARVGSSELLPVITCAALALAFHFILSLPLQAIICFSCYSFSLCYFLSHNFYPLHSLT